MVLGLRLVSLGMGRLEVVIEGAVGGFVEFFGIEGFVGGCWIGFRWVGCRFDHDAVSYTHLTLPTKA